MDIGKEIEGEDTHIIMRSLAYGVFVSIISAFILVRTDHAGWACGFSVGAGLSLISLYSLGVLIPRLMLPSAPRASQFLLALALFLKLPLYAGALYFVTCMRGVDARSAFPGLMLAPAVITGRTVGRLILQSARDAARRVMIMRGGIRMTRSRRAKSTPVVEPASEQG